MAFVDGPARRYHVLDPDRGALTSIGFDNRVGSAAPARGGGAIVALADGLARVAADGAVRRISSSVTDGVFFNDGKCDPRGRFWVGSRSEAGASGEGALFCLDGHGSIRREGEGFDICNGMGWSPDGHSFYLIDTVPRIVYRYDFDMERGIVGPRRVLHQFDGSRGKPDGMAIDAEGRLYCAMWDGAGIAILSPDGKLLGWIDIPAKRPTSCAFGGADRRTLFVTTATTKTPPDFSRSPPAGAILAYACATPGLTVPLYG
ncbi:sugar lactone lactonase YvrE [Sphingomonas zeicaulis]